MNTTMQFAPKTVMARKDLDIRAGDTVRVHVKIQEKDKTRIQIFEGLVIAKKHGSEPGATFTVRKISNGVGIERIFPLYSPAIEKIEVVKRARVRQSKLYYIRTKVARDIRRKMRNLVDYTATTDDLVIPAEEMLDETPEEAEAETTAPSEEVSVGEEKNEEAEAAPKEEATTAPEVKAVEDEAPAPEEEKSTESPTEEEKEA